MNCKNLHCKIFNVTAILQDLFSKTMNIMVIGNGKSIKIESEYGVARDQNLIGILPAVQKLFETFVVASTQCNPSPILRYGYSLPLPLYKIS